MTKQAFYQAVAHNMARNQGLRPQDVQLILSPSERENWSFSNGVASCITLTSYSPVETLLADVKPPKTKTITHGY
ncbi:MAG: hypothetical protein EOO60_02745 [Hymenobacter sp.]|nr:MAG: hypothetical protein EOO60_02745 [Hymenobacter sp.]